MHETCACTSKLPHLGACNICWLLIGMFMSLGSTYKKVPLLFANSGYKTIFMGQLAFTLCKWFVGGARLEECKESEWATLTKYWGMLEFATKQVVMVVAQALMKNS